MEGWVDGKDKADGTDGADEKDGADQRPIPVYCHNHVRIEFLHLQIIDITTAFDFQGKIVQCKEKQKVLARLVGIIINDYTNNGCGKLK
jgi:hypothetical protein